MRFNAKKCQIMSITRGKSHPTHLYTLCGHVLSSVQEAKCLGITLTDELSWYSHVRSIHNRANLTLGFLRRNFHRCPAKLKRNCVHYVSTLHIRICSTSLGPLFDQGGIVTTSSVTQMLHDLSWRDLSDRRRDLRLALLYKVHDARYKTGHVAVGPDQIGLVFFFSYACHLP